MAFLQTVISCGELCLDGRQCEWRAMFSARRVRAIAWNRSLMWVALRACHPSRGILVAQDAAPGGRLCTATVRKLATRAELVRRAYGKQTRNMHPGQL